MRKRLSLKTISETISGAVRRFPVSVIFLAVFAASVVTDNHCDDILPERWWFFLHWWCGTAALLNVVLQLWNESAARQVSDDVEIAHDNGWVSWCMPFIVNALWLGLAVLFSRHWPADIAWNVAAAVIPVILAVSIPMIPSLVSRTAGANGDIGLWNHIVDTASGALTAIAVMLLLTIGIDVLLFAIDSLFGADISWKLYMDVVWVCTMFAGPLVFLHLIPLTENTAPERPGKTGLALVHYILMPLLAAYLITLYAYAAKILIAWELPNGGVSMLISISMLCLVLVIFFIYPVQFRGTERRMDGRILRWLPAVFLPLLLLMTVGIIRRISDYGITIMRLYLILFNVWCYIVCIGLIACRSRRFGWVPLSFMALLLLSSSGSWNFTSVTRRTLMRQVQNEINANAPDAVFPLDSAMYDSLMNNGDSAFVFKVDSKMSYISDKFPAASYSLVDSSFSYRWEFGLYANDVQVDTVAVDNSSMWSVYPVNADMLTFPDGYDGIIPEFHLTRKLPASDTLYFNVTADSLHVALPLAPLKEASALQGIGSYPVYGERVIIYPSELVVFITDDGCLDLTISGTALIKTFSPR